MAQNNQLGMLAHLLGIFTGFLGPLIIFLVNKEKKGPVYDNIRHALNFHLSLLLYSFILMILFIISFLLVFLLIGIILLPIVILLMVCLSLLNIVCSIIGAVKANNGEVYKYPLEIPFIR